MDTMDRILTALERLVCRSDWFGVHKPALKEKLAEISGKEKVRAFDLTDAQREDFRSWLEGYITVALPVSAQVTAATAEQSSIVMDDPFTSLADSLAEQAKEMREAYDTFKEVGAKEVAAELLMCAVRLESSAKAIRQYSLTAEPGE